MKWALRDLNSNERIEATPQARGYCPSCKTALKAYCGQIIGHHWEHITTDCDKWTEPEGKWHLDWKNRFPAEYQEISLTANFRNRGGQHRADIFISGNSRLGRRYGTVIELQHSSISVNEILEREHFYRSMVWIFDGTTLGDRFEWYKRDGSKLSNDMWAYTWKHARTSIEICKCPVYVDLGDDGIFELMKFSKRLGSGFGGYGRLYSVNDLVQKLNNA